LRCRWGVLDDSPMEVKRMNSNQVRRFPCLAAIALGLAGANVTALPSFRGLGDLAGGDADSGALGVSADGSTVVGGGLDATGPRAFRWRQETGLIGIPDFAGGFVPNVAFATSGDGSAVVGRAWPGVGLGTYPFVWTPNDGARTIPFYAGTQMGIWAATGVSEDGSVIVGEGIPDSEQRVSLDRGIGDRSNSFFAGDRGKLVYRRFRR
jgi:hypothetical protein